jgi:NitT/TauT family transport system substrate-binding protein
MMGIGKILTLTVLASLLPWSLWAQERILVSYDGHSGFQGPIWASKDLGLLEKHGLNAELVMIPGGARAMQALVSGSTHFAQGSATAPISVRLQGGDVAIIATALNKFPFSLVSQKEIAKPADLVGKKIGIVNFGGSNELAVALALKEWNIPRQAVTLLPSGEAATRLIALSTKALDATVLSPPYTAEAVRMGMNILAHMSDMKAAFPQTVITVRRSFLEKNRETVKRFVRAYSEAIYVFITDKERAIAVYTKRLKQKNPQVLDETYGYFAGKFSIPPRADREGVMNVLSSAGQGKGAEPAQFLDESVIEELEREGFYKKLMGAK